MVHRAPPVRPVLCSGTLGNSVSLHVKTPCTRGTDLGTFSAAEARGNRPGGHATGHAECADGRCDQAALGPRHRHAPCEGQGPREALPAAPGGGAAGRVRGRGHRAIEFKEWHTFPKRQKAWGKEHTGPGIRFLCVSDAIDDPDHKGFWTTLSLFNRWRHEAAAAAATAVASM